MKNFTESITSFRSDAPFAPPEWALLERQLIDVLNRAALEFADRYTRSDRTLIWRDRWPGMDGSDDPYEAFMQFPLFYALGGSEKVNELSKQIWDSITWQWTEYGQIHREFDAYYDWMHHGEGYLFFYFFGLADPSVLKDKQRSVRFANMYTGDDPEAPNYDKEKKLIRSPITGSRGPRFQQTAEDWETHREILDNYLPPFADLPGVEGDSHQCPWSDDATYSEILSRINERFSRGDVPLNLNATSMIANAYMFTGADKYRDWVEDYVLAWKKRMEQNGGIMPDNIGLSGEIGEYNDGKWWGGYYGWRWPHGAMTVLSPTLVGASNALLMTGNRQYLDLIRSQLDMLWDLRREVDGKWLVPRRHFDDGWREYMPMHPMYAIHTWNLSMSEEDAERAERCGVMDKFPHPDPNPSCFLGNGFSAGFYCNTVQWFRYIRGQDPDYPVNLLKMNYQTIGFQLEKMRSDERDPHLIDHYRESMSIHQWQDFNPMLIEGLAQLTLGGPMHVYHGGLQHARVRYYDAAAKRPGLPSHVGALVEQLRDDSVTLQLVNLDLFEAKEVVIQAGMFGEHLFESMSCYNQQDEPIGSGSVGGKWLQVQLMPGCGVKMTIAMKRFVHAPSYETPWHKPEEGQSIISGRTT